MVVGVVFQSCQLRDIIHSEPCAPIIHAHVLSVQRGARYATLPGVLAAVLVLLVLYMTVVVATVACSHPLQAALATTAALCRGLLALFVVMVVFGERTPAHTVVCFRCSSFACTESIVQRDTSACMR